MSSAVITVIADNVVDDVLGVKEAAVMALEGLGGVRVTRVQIMEDEQIRMDGETGVVRKMSWDAPAGAEAPRRKPPVTIDCCYTCAWFCSDRKADASGKMQWGVCSNTGRALYEINKRCDKWKRG